MTTVKEMLTPNAAVFAAKAMLERGHTPQIAFEAWRDGVPIGALFGPSAMMETGRQRDAFMQAVLFLRVFQADAATFVADIWQKIVAPGETDVVRPSDDPESRQAVQLLVTVRGGGAGIRHWFYDVKDDGTIEWTDERTDTATPAEVSQGIAGGMAEALALGVDGHFDSEPPETVDVLRREIATTLPAVGWSVLVTEDQVSQLPEARAWTVANAEAEIVGDGFDLEALRRRMHEET